MSAGASHGVVNFGQATMNMMRLEHGYKLWGRELTLDTNPFEAGLGGSPDPFIFIKYSGLINFEKKGDFIGRQASERLKDKTFDRRLALLTFPPEKNEKIPLEWRTLPFGNEVVRRVGQEERIGQITSGSYSVRLQRPIAFAWISNDIDNNQEVIIIYSNKNNLNIQLSVDIGLDHRLTANILQELPHAPTY